jgi:hypothetical protein
MRPFCQFIEGELLVTRTAIGMKVTFSYMR